MPACSSERRRSSPACWSTATASGESATTRAVMPFARVAQVQLDGAELGRVQVEPGAGDPRGRGAICSAASTVRAACWSGTAPRDRRRRRRSPARPRPAAAAAVAGAVGRRGALGRRGTGAASAARAGVTPVRDGGLGGARVGVRVRVLRRRRSRGPWPLACRSPARPAVAGGVALRPAAAPGRRPGGLGRRRGVAGLGVAVGSAAALGGRRRRPASAAGVAARLRAGGGDRRGRDGGLRPPAAAGSDGRRRRGVAGAAGVWPATTGAATAARASATASANGVVATTGAAAGSPAVGRPATGARGRPRAPGARSEPRAAGRRSGRSSTFGRRLRAVLEARVRPLVAMLGARPALSFVVGAFRSGGPGPVVLEERRERRLPGRRAASGGAGPAGARRRRRGDGWQGCSWTWGYGRFIGRGGGSLDLGGRPFDGRPEPAWTGHSGRAHARGRRFRRRRPMTDAMSVAASPASPARRRGGAALPCRAGGADGRAAGQHGDPRRSPASTRVGQQLTGDQRHVDADDRP